MINQRNKKNEVEDSDDDQYLKAVEERRKAYI